MSLDSFWSVIDDQIKELRTAANADDVLCILANERNPYGGSSAGDGFFAGSGGDASVQEALGDAGWRVIWSEASYYYVMKAPDGSAITYIEGDIYRGDRAPTTTSEADEES